MKTKKQVKKKRTQRKVKVNLSRRQDRPVFDSTRFGGRDDPRDHPNDFADLEDITGYPGWSRH